MDQRTLVKTVTERALDVAKKAADMSENKGRKQREHKEKRILENLTNG